MPPSRPSTHHLERDIGALQATVALLAEAVKEQAVMHERTMAAQQKQYSEALLEFKSMVASADKKIEALKDEIAAMKSLIDQAKGGWKILVGVGTISATLGAFVGKVASVFFTAPKP